MKNDALRIKILCVTLDCDDAQTLADFYAKLLGWKKGCNNEGWVWVSAPKQYPYLLFQQVEGYRPPVWPQQAGAQSQMEHIDFAVNDLEKAVRHALDCGAKEADEQCSDSWRVMIDPAGHPFCLCLKKTIFTFDK